MCHFISNLAHQLKRKFKFIPPLGPRRLSVSRLDFTFLNYTLHVTRPSSRLLPLDGAKVSIWDSAVFPHTPVTLRVPRHCLGPHIAYPTTACPSLWLSFPTSWWLKTISNLATCPLPKLTRSHPLQDFSSLCMRLWTYQKRKYERRTIMNVCAKANLPLWWAGRCPLYRERCWRQ